MAAAHVGACVKMSDEANGRSIGRSPGACREGSHEVAVVVEGDVAQSDGGEFVAQMACEHHLAWC